jgi:hypothetical protein
MLRIASMKLANAAGRLGRKAADKLTGTDDELGLIQSIKLSYKAGTKGHKLPIHKASVPHEPDSDVNEFLAAVQATEWYRK